MTSGRRYGLRHLLQNVYSRRHHAVLEVFAQIHIVSVHLPVAPFPLVHHFSDVVDVLVSEFPLVVGVVLEYFETFIDPLLHPTQSRGADENVILWSVAELQV